jgi:rfaE bifunctional protein nucleotidyltransferase chain/domain
MLRRLSSSSKIIPLAALPQWREQIRATGRRLVVTNGCFDLLHAGHVAYLETARAQGDLLLVGLNGDESVRQLKGPSRPLNSESDRAVVLAALACVDAVSIFPDVRAVSFLGLSQPDVWVKGGDYTLETVNADERRAVEKGGGRIVFVPFVTGKSTTSLVEKIQRL